MIEANSIATIVFNGGATAWIGVALALAGSIWCIIGYRRRVTKFTARTVAPVILRIVALALLALCLAEPSLVGEEADPGANLVAVIVDNSRGMQIRDAGEKQTRAEELADLLQDSGGDEAAWLSTIADTFALRRFALDSRMRRVGEFQSLDFSGKAVVHLAADPNVMAKTGKIVLTADLASEYGFTDEGGVITGDMRSIKFNLILNGRTTLANFVPACVRIPSFLFYFAGYKF